MNNANIEQERTLCRNAINRLLRSGCPFALFRYPQADKTELILQKEGEAYIVKGTEQELNGFIFAPFHDTDRCPTLLIKPSIHLKGWNQIIEITEKLPEKKETFGNLNEENVRSESATCDAFYENHFHSVFSQIQQGNVEKIVLAHCQKESGKHHLLGKEADIFLNALSSHSNTMLSLVYTPQSGRWIGSTPELFLQHAGNEWSTMALAGTRTLDDGEWDRKNQLEQELVTRYIRSTLQHLGADVTQGQSTTMHAATLMHIRTDIHFRFSTLPRTIQIIKALHPTPAVCGSPKEPALQHILRNEGESRRYFSGYLGTIFEDREAHLFVNLRCAQICQDATYYHAGGGITFLSQLSKEHLEILRKISILKNLNHPHP